MGWWKGFGDNFGQRVEATFLLVFAPIFTAIALLGALGYAAWWILKRILNG